MTTRGRRTNRIGVDTHIGHLEPDPWVSTVAPTGRITIPDYHITVDGNHHLDEGPVMIRAFHGHQERVTGRIDTRMATGRPLVKPP